MKYQVTIQTLTPLHISSGMELLAGFDYVSDHKQTFILDQDAIYARELEINGSADARLDQPAGIIGREHWHGEVPSPQSEFVRYVLQGATPKDVERLQEQIKDAYGKCYLPGSSLKGAIRRALMAWAIGKANMRPHWGKLQDSDVRADDRWDAYIFGNDPHHDVMRLLQVRDSDALKDNDMVFLHIRVFQKDEKPGSPIELEAVAPQTIFNTEIRVDEILLQYTNQNAPGMQDHANELRWARKIGWFTILPQILKQTGLQLLETERNTAYDWGWTQTVAEYDKLLAEHKSLADNEAMLQIGWGGGWLSKTLGLEMDQGGVDYVRDRYNLGSKIKSGDEWRIDWRKPFPSSRRLRAILPVSEGDPTPAEPLGWVKITFEQVPERMMMDDRFTAYWERIRRQAQPLLARPWRPLTDAPAVDK